MSDVSNLGNSCNMFLDFEEYLEYKNCSRKYISVWNSLPFTSYKVGDWVEIDLDKISCENGPGLFGINTVRKVSSSTNVITTRGSSSNIVISPSAVNAMNSPNAMDLARRMSEMVDATGKEYEFKIEDPNSKLNYSLICRKGN